MVEEEGRRLFSYEKMKIKLTIPRPEAKEQDADEEVVTANPPPPFGKVRGKPKPLLGQKICLICNKRFVNGKALGGHMRIHVRPHCNINGRIGAGSSNTSSNTTEANHPSRPKKQLMRTSSSSHIDKNNNDNPAGTYHDGSTITCKDDAMYVDDGDQCNGVRPPTCTSTRPICAVCHKEFKNLKSLFGHMRCHPEREWRGIQPPKLRPSSPTLVLDLNPLTPTASSPEAAASRPVLDLSSAAERLRSLPGWGATGKRGGYKGANVDDRDLISKAVSDLMWLAYGGGTPETDQELEDEEGRCGGKRSFLDTHEKEADAGAAAGGSTSKKPRLVLYDSDDEYWLRDHVLDETQTMSSVLCSAKGGADQKLLIDGAGKIETCNIEWEPAEEASKSRIKKEESKMMTTTINDHMGSETTNKQSKNSTIRAPAEKFTCSTCNKIFPSHHALGGHRSSHYKERINHHLIGESSSLADEIMVSSSYLDADHESTGYVTTIAAAAATPCRRTVTSHVHRCKICNKTFPSGRALGGHQRCHWVTSPVESRWASCSQEESPVRAREADTKSNSELDLHEPAAAGAMVSEAHAAADYTKFGPQMSTAMLTAGL